MSVKVIGLFVRQSFGLKSSIQNSKIVSVLGYGRQNFAEL